MGPDTVLGALHLTRAQTLSLIELAGQGWQVSRLASYFQLRHRVVRELLAANADDIEYLLVKCKCRDPMPALPPRLCDQDLGIRAMVLMAHTLSRH